ncbi:MAG: acetylglutamate kinase [Blastocatellia bacterium]|nr:MAG: acetylglutamate kinase [Blastocatellia bacterium]
MKPLVLKFGGELLEQPERLREIVKAVGNIAATGPLVIVHGGGREIDEALRCAGIEKRQVDGLRITDEATLNVVVAVLAGTVNTRFVAHLNAAGVAAVGLTGADGAIGLSEAAAPHIAGDGRVVELGRVGIPTIQGRTRLLQTLVDEGFVPVIACIGMQPDGLLLNVNADTFAGRLAWRLGARRLVIAGTTPGMLGTDGTTVPVVQSSAITHLTTNGTATAGMIAKLRACDDALAHGVDDVMIVDGRDPMALMTAAGDAVPQSGTRVAREI